MKHRYSKSDHCGRVFRHLPRSNRAMCARLIIIANSTQSASKIWLWHLKSRAYMMETDENESYYKEFYVSPGKATALCYWLFPKKSRGTKRFMQRRLSLFHGSGTSFALALKLNGFTAPVFFFSSLHTDLSAGCISY